MQLIKTIRNLSRTKVLLISIFSIYMVLTISLTYYCSKWWHNSAEVLILGIGLGCLFYVGTVGFINTFVRNSFRNLKLAEDLKAMYNLTNNLNTFDNRVNYTGLCSLAATIDGNLPREELFKYIESNKPFWAYYYQKRIIPGSLYWYYPFHWRYRKLWLKYHIFINS